MPTSHVRHPRPLNQFYRLDRDTPTSPWVKTTRWNHTHAQATGSVINWDGYLCMAAAGAVALDAHTAGRYQFSAGQIHDRQNDMMGGIGVDDVKTAWAAFGQVFITPDGFDRTELVRVLRARVHVVIGVDYSALPLELRVQKPGLFDHAINLDDIDGSQTYRYDSLDTVGRWKPLEPYLDAAEALALRVRRTKASLFVGLTKQRAALNSLDTYRVVIDGNTTTRRTPLYHTPNGARAGAISEASYIVSRHKVDGLWWFQIISQADGGSTELARRWFKPNRWMTFTED